MHKAISTKVQGKTSYETTQQCQSNFLFFTFYVVFGFLTHKNEKIDQKQQCKDNENKQRKNNNNNNNNCPTK